MKWKEFLEKAKKAGVIDETEIVIIEFMDEPQFYFEEENGVKRVWIE